MIQFGVEAVKNPKLSLYGVTVIINLTIYSIDIEIRHTNASVMLLFSSIDLLIDSSRLRIF